MPGNVERRLLGILEEPDLQHDGNALQARLVENMTTLLDRPANRAGVLSFVNQLLGSSAEDRLLAVTLIGDTNLSEFRQQLVAASTSDIGVRRLFGLDAVHNLNSGYGYRELLARVISDLSPSTPPTNAA
jgi:hypothetical protein